MEEDAGYFFEMRSRLQGQLARHHWTLGKPFTPAQQDAWTLLNEIEQVIKVLERLAKTLPQDNGSELAYQVRHTLLTHKPAWKAKAEASGDEGR
jgi:hypothetical protein